MLTEADITIISLSLSQTQYLLFWILLIKLTAQNYLQLWVWYKLQIKFQKAEKVKPVHICFEEWFCDFYLKMCLSSLWTLRGRKCTENSVFRSVTVSCMLVEGQFRTIIIRLTSLWLLSFNTFSFDIRIWQSSLVQCQTPSLTSDFKLFIFQMLLYLIDLAISFKLGETSHTDKTFVYINI